MTTSNVTTKWIEAGKKLAVDAHADVLCPVHEDANLIVTDIPIAGSQKFERIMECPKCGARNVLLMNK